MVNLLKQSKGVSYSDLGLSSQFKKNLIVFDRSADFLTPLLNQRHFEGLVDEFYGISQNRVDSFKFRQEEGEVKIEKKNSVQIE